MTNHTTTYIRREMDLAEAHEFQTLWFEREGIEWVAGLGRTSALKRRL